MTRSNTAIKDATYATNGRRLIKSSRNVIINEAHTNITADKYEAISGKMSLLFYTKNKNVIIQEFDRFAISKLLT